MSTIDEEKKARGCLFALIKIMVLGIGIFLLVRERFDVILRVANPWWWTLSVLSAVILLFIIARYIYRR